MSNEFALHSIHTFNLEAIGQAVGLTRLSTEAPDDFASRCHHHIDALIRDHALRNGDMKIIAYMELHDEIETCFTQ